MHSNDQLLRALFITNKALFEKRFKENFIKSVQKYETDSGVKLTAKPGDVFDQLFTEKKVTIQVPTKRDYSFYKVNNVEARKGKTVVNVVRMYLQNHPNKSFSALKQIFSDKILAKSPMPFLAQKNEIPEKYVNRYYKQPFTSGDGKKFYVNLQWETKNFTTFVKAMNQVGFKITKVAQ